MSTVMVVEDDAPLRSALVTSLGAYHYEVVDFATGEEAVVASGFREPDLVLLDLTLPGIDGLETLRRLRTFSAVPVVVLTVRDGKADKLAALDGGADDYVVKPFDTEELLARIRAALRRRPESTESAAVVRVDGLEIDRSRGEVTRDGREIHLTPTELRMLDLLVGSDGRLLRYSDVAQHISGGRKDLDQGALRVFVAQLRKKLGDDAADPKLILTHYGLGYRWIAGEQPSMTDSASARPASARS